MTAAPLYFGPDDARRFGIHRAAAGPRRRRVGVVIVPPFEAERNDAMRSVRRLAATLAEDGFAVLRYDPWGSGDSYGDGAEARWHRWLDDVPLAITELRRRSGIGVVALVGVRLGALVAWAHRDRRDVTHLALWEPVLDGASYVRSLRDEHTAWLADELRERPGAFGYQGSHEALGAPLPPALVRDLEGVSFEARTPRRARVLIAASTPDAALPSSRSVTHHTLQEPAVWDADAGMDAAPVATEAIRAIAGWLGGAA